MRKILFFLSLFLLVILSARAEKYKNIHSLEKGDWLMIESVEYHPYVAPGLKDEIPWRSENIRRVRVKANVEKVASGQITFGFQMQHIYECKNVGEESSFYYYDSDYYKGYDQKKVGWVTENNGDRVDVTPDQVFGRITYDLSTGELLHTEIKEGGYLFHYSLQITAFGIQRKIKPNTSGMATGVVNIEQLLFKSIPELLIHWNRGESFVSSVRIFEAKPHGRPMYSPYIGRLPDDVSYDLLPRDSRVVDASFALPPNVFLKYEEINTSEMREEIFFIPRPIRYVPQAEINATMYHPILIYPGDSIIRTLEANTGRPLFAGTGAAQNMYPYWNRKLTGNAEYTQKGEELYLQLNNFWKRTFDLSESYYQARDCAFEAFRDVLSNAAAVEWDQPCFQNLCPLVDYQYLPPVYGQFLYQYINRKKYQIGSETINPAYPLMVKDQKEEYYVRKTLLTGYPQSLMCYEALYRAFGDNMLKDFQTEYEDFMQNCPEKELTTIIQQLYKSLQQLEKGRNIKDTKIELAKRLLPSFGSDRKYILTEIYLHAKRTDGDIRAAELLHKQLKEKNLENDVTVCLYHNNNIPEYFTDRMETLQALFTPMSEDLLRHDLETVKSAAKLVILMREDGTILYRSLSLSDLSMLVDLIEEDINRAQSSYWPAFWRGFIFAFVFAVIAVFLVRYRLNNKRKKEQQQRQIKELELKAIRSQMNPHFVFNALGSIQNLINRGDNVQANEYLVQFSRMVRKVLNNSEKKMVALSEEIDQLYLYLSLEQLRFPFVYTIRVDDAIETDLVEIPGMLIQPFVENAVKHGIAPQGKGNIDIDIRQQGEILVVDIVDDGPGLSGAPSEGFGMKAIQEEFQILKALYETEPVIRITDRKEAEGCTGCRVTLSIPVQ
ncbi:histidine kinase [Parabacteroides sp. OttesenSCG-928-K15]|nr:histidine kinase [Parabacteroides sp. OttesenSCG-928-K15]